MRHSIKVLSFLALSNIFVGASSLIMLPASAETAAQENPAVVETSSGKSCSVKCNDPHPACSEAARVIDTLNTLTQLINDGKFDAMGEYFDEGVSAYNGDTKKMIIGKEAVLADIKSRYETHLKGEHLVSYTIDQPYAKVTGNRAVVTFVAKKIISGSHPVSMESHSTEVFVKDGDKWKTLHYRGAWKKSSS